MKYARNGGPHPYQVVKPTIGNGEAVGVKRQDIAVDVLQLDAHRSDIKHVTVPCASPKLRPRLVKGVLDVFTVVLPCIELLSITVNCNNHLEVYLGVKVDCIKAYLQ